LTQINLRQTDAQQIEGGDDQGIQENNYQDESSRAWDKKTHAGQ